MGSVIKLHPDKPSFVEGLHREVDSYIYHQLDCVSSHRLGLLRRSPAHLRYSIDHPTTSTPAMILGTAIHDCVLEPGKFEAKYVAAPAISRRTTVGKEAYAAFEVVHRDKIILDAEDHQMCLEAANAVAGHEIANNLLSELDEIEITGIWKDEETGLLCKMRADGLSRSVRNISDLKSTANASRREFERSIFNFGYHRQGAFYVDGMRALGEKIDHYTIIAFEKSAPYPVAVYRLEDDILELGRRENRRIMHLYARCVESGEWPAYPLQVQDIGIPNWAIKQIEEEFYE